MDEGEEFGPAMAGLSERHRAFVRAVLDHPTAKGEDLSIAAGFRNSPGGHRVTAHRLLHDERVIAAISEETAKRVRFGGLIGVAGLIKMASSPDHADHYKACVALADRGGFAAKTEHKVTVEHVDHGRMAQIAARLAAELGLDGMKLIGGNVIEGEAVNDPQIQPNDLAGVAVAK